ncbi:hypothetical protein PTKIN_Ptkin03bG0252200 [Pterospermum kingtungense]
MIMPTQKHGDTSSEDVKPSFLLLCHQQTTLSETGFRWFLRPVAAMIRFGARKKHNSSSRHVGRALAAVDSAFGARTRMQKTAAKLYFNYDDNL